MLASNVNQKEELSYWSQLLSSTLRLYICNSFDIYIIFYFQVKVLYDFDGDPDNGELSVRAGEELTVTAQVSRLKK